ncbi:MAG: DUF4382 domain-containing protein [Candidatus Micrarchaeota archaeon]
MRGILYLLLASLLLAGCYSPPAAQSGGTGRVVFTIADAAADMGAVSSIKVTVDSVSVHSASKGWVTVSSTPKTYDLMELRASAERSLLADAQLDSGEYQQMRLQISKVLVADASGTHEAKLPSGEMKITGGFNVTPDSTSTATFDISADESLHVTGDGQYILAPVITVETRENASAVVESDVRVKISGGSVRTSTRVGMDEKGNVGPGLKIPAGASVSISGGVISITPPGINVTGKGKIVVGITDAAANMSAVEKIKVTVDNVMVQDSGGGWVTVSSEPKTFDLLELRDEGATELYAEAEIPEGDYNQIRLDISNVVVTDSSGDHEAMLPSGELKVIGDLSVKEGETSTATFDFIADESLHTTGNGTYVLAPVVKVETRDDAAVEEEAGARIKVKGGKIKTNVTVGMDAGGNVGVGLRIPASAAVSISGGVIVVTPPKGDGTIIDVGGVVGGGSSPSVTIQDFAFSPADLTVSKGTTVTWTNQDNAPHSVIFGDGIVSPTLGKGQSYSRTFDEEGEFSYSCGIHTSMSGRIEVS